MNPFAEMALAAKLARREMRVGLRGFGVFLWCLFLGVFAVTAVGSFSASARSGLMADARSLLGGDVEVRLTHRELTPPQREYLESRGRVGSIAEMRAMAGRVRSQPPESGSGKKALVELKAVDGAYPLYGRVALIPDQPLAKALEPRDGVPGAVVEDTLLKRLGLAVGERLAVGQGQYEVRAVLASEPDRAIRAFNLGPRLLVSRASLASTGLVQPGSLVRYAYRVALHAQPMDGQGTDAFVAELNRSFPDAGWRVRGFEKAAPRVRYFLDRTETDLTLMGLCALLVGGLGVAGAVRGYLDGKRSHIAAMKCVGASGSLLFRAYMLQILTLGAIGSSAGIVLGAAVPHAAAWLWGEALPVPLRPGFYPGPMAVGALFGLLVAVTFSLRALGSARRVRPAELFRGYVADEKRPRPGRAVNAAVVIAVGLMAGLAAVASGDARTTLWFAAGAAACFLLFRLLAVAVVFAARKVPRLPNPSLRLAVANIHRPGATAPAAIFSLGLGLTALVAVTLVEANLSHLVAETVTEEAPSFFFIDIQRDQVADFDEAVRTTNAVTRVERVPTLRGRITHIAGVPVAEARIKPEVSWAVRGDRFLTYAARPPNPLTLSAGTWWPKDYSGPPRISLTADLGEGFGVSVGDTLTINVLGRVVTAEIANLRSVDWSTLALNFAIVFAPGVLEAAPQSHIAAVYAPPNREESVFDAITGRFPNVSAIRIKEVLQNVARVLRRIGATFQGMAAVTLISGLLVVAGAVSADQRRRIRDAVIFKVCGATRRDVLGAFAAEFLILGLVAGIIAVVVGAAAAYAMVTWVIDAEFTFRPWAAVLTVCAGLVLTLGLGLAGTARALARKPAPYLRNE